MIAGSEYCHRSCPMVFVPRSFGVFGLCVWESTGIGEIVWVLKKAGRIISNGFSVLVAGAGLEPTTFGL